MQIFSLTAKVHLGLWCDDTSFDTQVPWEGRNGCLKRESLRDGFTLSTPFVCSVESSTTLCRTAIHQAAASHAGGMHDRYLSLGDS